jgi:hypothetical protein
VLITKDALVGAFFTENGLNYLKATFFDQDEVSAHIN